MPSSHRFLTVPIYYAIFFFAIITAILPACSDGIGQTPDEHINRAKDLQDNGDFNAAIIELKNALLQAPDNLEARFILGQIYVDTGDGPDAENELKRAIKLGLSPEAAAIPLTRALLLQVKFQQMLDISVAPESLNKTDQAELLALRGNAYFGLGKFDMAEKFYDTALSIDAGNPEAEAGKALVAIERNQLDEARDQLTKMLQKNPKFVPAWRYLGDIEVRDGHPDKAVKMYDRAIELNKYLTTDLVKRADAKFQLGDFAGARNDIELLKNKGITMPYMYFIEGKIYFKEKKYADAQQAFEQALNLDPDSLPIQIYLATCHGIQGHTQQALALANRVISNAPNSSGARNLLAAAQISNSQFKNARTVLEESLKNNPNDGFALSLLGDIALQQGRAIDSVEYFSRAAALTPDSIALKQKLKFAKVMAGKDIGGASASSQSAENEFLSALEAFKKGDFRKALEIAQRYQNAHPDMVDPLNLMAACYLAMAEWPNARTTLEKALQIEPFNNSATINLAKLEARVGNLDRAKNLLSAFLEQKQGDAQASSLLAEIDTQLGNNASTIQTLEQAVKSNPDTASLRVALAQSYYKASRFGDVLAITQNIDPKQFQEQPVLLELQGKAYSLTGNISSAIQSFKQLTQLAPDSASAHSLYSESLSEGGQPDRAQQEYDRAIQIDPKYLPARFHEIKLLIQRGKLESAHQKLAKLKADFKGSPEVFEIEGRLSLADNDYSSAVEHLSQAVEKRPNTELTILLASALWSQQKYDQSVTVMKDWLEHHPRDFVVILQLASAYVTLEREEDAVTMYTRILELNPNHVPTLNNLSWLLRDQDLERAIAYGTRAHDLAPNDPQVADTLGTLLLKRGDTTRGYGLIRKAAEQAPENPEIQLHFGRALIERKQFAQAQEVLSSVITKFPDSKFSDEAKVVIDSMPQK